MNQEKKRVKNSMERNQERRQNQYKVREQALRDKSKRERKIEIQTQGS